MLVLLFFLCFFGAPDELNRNIQMYWDALLVSDKASALDFVYPEDLNNFINRREARFESWKLLDTEITSENEAEVRIQLERILPNGVVGSVKGKETWVQHAGSWKVRVKPSGEQYRSMVGRSSAPKKATRKSNELEVRPDILNFYALSPRQPRFLHLWNGLDVPAKIIEVSVDPERFQIIQLPENIEVQSTATLKFQYTGSDTGENLESEIRLRLLHDGVTREFVVPVVYNYVDEVTRWVSGQQPKKANPD